MNDDDAVLGATLILALASLTEWEREVVVCRNVHGQTLRQLADRHGVTRQAVSETNRKALAKLRARLTPYRDELLAA